MDLGPITLGVDRVDGDAEATQASDDPQGAVVLRADDQHRRAGIDPIEGPRGTAHDDRVGTGSDPTTMPVSGVRDIGHADLHASGAMGRLVWAG